MKYGDIITVAGKYRRVNRYITNNEGFGRKDRKEWEFVSGEITGIYLGKRTLRNGHVEYDEEYGYIFTPDDTLQVILISPSAIKNPVYAPVVKVKP